MSVITEALLISSPMLLIFIVTLVLALLRPNRKKPVPTIEHYAPDGINPAEASFVITGDIDSHDIFSLIYHWAAHGYILIEDHTEDRTSEDEPRLILYRKGSLDDAHRKYEKELFDALWAIGNGKTATDKDLDECISRHISSAVEELPYVYSCSTALVDKASGKLPALARNLPVIVFNIISFVFSLLGGRPYAFVALLFMSLCLLVLQRARERHTYGVNPVKISNLQSGLIAAIGIAAIVFFRNLEVTITPFLIITTINLIIGCAILLIYLRYSTAMIGYIKNPNYTLPDKNNGKALAFISQIITTVAMMMAAYSFGSDIGVSASLAFALYALFMSLTMMLSGRLYRRTDYCIKLMGRCIGLRETLKAARKDEVEMLCKEDPDYYYDVLPYLQVFGLTKIWNDRFDYLINGKFDA